MEQDQIDKAVYTSLVEALGVSEEEVTSEATLLGDLEAESIDLLDILFRLERETNVKITAADLAEHVQGGISDEDFGADDGKVSDEGLEQLSRVMPQLDVEALRGNLPASSVMELFTVQNLCDLVRGRVAAVSS